MINRETGSLYYWKQTDWEPLRFLIAIIISLTLIGSIYKLEYFLTIKKLTITPKPILKRDRGHHYTTLNYITYDEYCSHYNFPRENDILKNAEKLVAKEIFATLNVPTTILPSYSFNPMTALTLPFLQEPILPSYPKRELPTIANPPITAAKETLTVKVSPNLSLDPTQIPSLPIQSLGQGLSSVQYQLALTKQGFVAYAIPASPNYDNQALTTWIQQLKFPPSSTKKLGFVRFISQQ